MILLYRSISCCYRQSFDCFWWWYDN